MADTSPKFVTVRYPGEAKFAAVHAAVTRGVLFIRVAAGGAVAAEQAQPGSPVYNLKNAACGRNVVVPLGSADGAPELVAVTAVNDSDEDGSLSVVVGVSYLPEATQKAKAIDIPLPKDGGSAFVQIVFHKVD